MNTGVGQIYGHKDPQLKTTKQVNNSIFELQAFVVVD